MTIEKELCARLLWPYSPRDVNDIQNPSSKKYNSSNCRIDLPSAQYSRTPYVNACDQDIEHLEKPTPCFLWQLIATCNKLARFPIKGFNRLAHPILSKHFKLSTFLTVTQISQLNQSCVDT
jgi:hypothetical protein